MLFCSWIQSFQGIFVIPDVICDSPRCGPRPACPAVAIYLHCTSVPVMASWPLLPNTMRVLLNTDGLSIQYSIFNIQYASAHWHADLTLPLFQSGVGSSEKSLSTNSISQGTTTLSLAGWKLLLAPPRPTTCGHTRCTRCHTTVVTSL